MSAARKARAPGAGASEREASPVLVPVASAAERTLGMFGEVVLERAARRVGADPREVLAAVAILQIDGPPLDDATAEALLVGVRELRKVAAGGAS